MKALPLTVHLVRSQVGDASVRGVDTSAATEQPGVVAVLTAGDLPAASSVAGRPTLASGPLRFQGQEVAAVVAEDPYAAADAAELVEVDLDFDSEESSTRPGAVDPAVADGLACRVAQPRWHVAPLQTQQCLAEPLDGGVIGVHVGVRDAEEFAAALAAASGLPTSRIRVIAASTRGRTVVSRDLLSPGHVVAVVAADRLGRAVAWQETRAESMTSGGSQAGFTGTAQVTASELPADIRLDIALLADIGAAQLGGRLGDSWRELDWYGFGAVEVSQQDDESPLPPALADGVEILGRVFLGDAAIDELARSSGRTRADVRSVLLDAGGACAKDLIREVEDSVGPADDGDGSGRGAVGAALAPGLAASARITLDDVTGEWQVAAVSVATSFALDADSLSAVRAGVVDGYGLTSMQEIPFDEQGNCLAATLMDYVMPSSWESPAATVVQVSVGATPTVSSDEARLLATAATAQATRNALASLLPGAAARTGVLTSSAVWEQLHV